MKAVIPNKPVDLCWQRTDRSVKKLDILFRRTKLESETANADTLENLGQDLQLVEQELEEL